MKKKLFLVLFLGLLLSGFIFANDMYIVQSINGRVEMEVSPGKWEEVTVGVSLSPSTVLNTGMSGNMVVRLNEKDITIKAMQRGTLGSLAAANDTSRVRIGGRISNSNIASSSRAASSTTTASTRASSMDEPEWAEP